MTSEKRKAKFFAINTFDAHTPLIEYRKRAVEFLELVTPGIVGSRESAIVAQGRIEAWHKYSSCVDLAHAMYEALKLEHRRINREPGWRIGKNVSLLTSWRDVALPILSNADWARVDGGDVLFRWRKPDTSDAHAVCVMANHGKTLSTAEWGQARPNVGRLFERLVRPGPRARPWQVWLPLPAVLRACGVEL